MEKWLENIPLNLTKKPEKKNPAAGPIREKKEPSSLAMNKKPSKPQINIKREPLKTVPKTRKRKAAEHPAQEPQLKTEPTAAARPPRKRKQDTNGEKVEGTWIPESRAFATDVIEDIISKLNNNMNDMSHPERSSLSQLRSLWEQKFNADERKPESNQKPLSPRPKRKYKPRANKKPKPGWIPAKEKGTITDDEDGEDVAIYYHWDDLEDNEIVKNQISVPPLLNKYSCRRFDIMMPAFAMKRNLIEPLFSWELLEKIMEPPLEEGTKILQQVVDEMLLQYGCGH